MRPSDAEYGLLISSITVAAGVVCQVQPSYDAAETAATSKPLARSERVATFGMRVRELRHAKDWSLRDLAGKVGVGFTYLSRVENERLNFGDYPSDDLIHRLADVLDADEYELLLLAKRVPEPVKRRVLQRPDAFLAFAACDDATLDRLLAQLDRTPKSRRARGKKAVS